MTLASILNPKVAAVVFALGVVVASEYAPGVYEWFDMTVAEYSRFNGETP